MATLYIRNRSCSYITFIHSKEEFQSFTEYYIPGRHLTIGDLSIFNKPMLNMLLKFIEEHPEVNCYSSSDLGDSIIQSRFVSVIKDPLEYLKNHNVEDYKLSDRSYMSVLSHLDGVPSERKLRIPLLSNNMLKLFV